MSTPLTFRPAEADDLENLVDMLADDELGAKREDDSRPVNPRYLDAFAAIDSDPNNELIVAEDGAALIGMMQLTFIPYLSRLGAWRCLIESVRVHKDCRGQGFGRAMFVRAISRACEKNCELVQLTSDKQRSGALSFYRSLGFEATHEGFKLNLQNFKE